MICPSHEFLPDMSFLGMLLSVPTVKWDVRPALQGSWLPAGQGPDSGCLPSSSPTTHLWLECLCELQEKRKIQEDLIWGKRTERTWRCKKITYTFGFLNLPCPSSKILFSKSRLTRQWGTLQSCHGVSESFFLLNFCLFVLGFFVWLFFTSFHLTPQAYFIERLIKYGSAIPEKQHYRGKEGPEVSKSR